jgi:hypothetical protein
MRSFLFSALLILSAWCTALGEDGSTADLSGPWMVVYNLSWGSSGNLSAESGALVLRQDGPEIEGNSSIGSRGDGSVSGECSGQSFEVTSTFSSCPALVLRLKGDQAEKNLSGRFQAVSSDGRVWRGSFFACRSDEALSLINQSQPKVDPMTYMTEAVSIAPPEPEGVMDYDAYWQINQSGKAKKTVVPIKRYKNMVYSFRNVPYYN